MLTQMTLYNYRKQLGSTLHSTLGKKAGKINVKISQGRCYYEMTRNSSMSTKNHRQWFICQNVFVSTVIPLFQAARHKVLSVIQYLQYPCMFTDSIETYFMCQMIQTKKWKYKHSRYQNCNNHIYRRSWKVVWKQSTWIGRNILHQVWFYLVVLFVLRTTPSWWTDVIRNAPIFYLI